MAALNATPTTLPTGADELAPPLTFREMAWRRFRRHRMAMVGAVTLILLFVYAFGGGLIYTAERANFTDTGARLQGPSLEHPIAATHNAFLFVLEGATMVGPSRREVRERELAVLGPGESVSLDTAGQQPVRALLLSGQPIGEPIARRGPFVMNTEAELDQAVADYRSGRFIEPG